MPTINNDELAAINMLEHNTGARAVDAVLGDEAVIFVVQKGDLGKAIGKQGANINKLRAAFGKRVEVVEAADDLKGFVANLFAPAAIKEARVSESGDKKSVIVLVEASQKGLAIGRNGERVKKARMLLERHFGVGDLKIL